MNKRVFWFVPLMVFLLLMVGFVVKLDTLQDRPETALDSALIGQPLPQVWSDDLSDLSKRHRLDALSGQPFLLNVWATWCPTCLAEHQFLGQLKQQGVTIIGINYKDQRQQALEWLNQYGNPYQLSLYDPKGELGIELGVYGAPETFYIDEQGVIRYRWVGEMNQSTWDKVFKDRFAGAQRESM
ncbi:MULTISPECIES: DsbE family thiol:disulfide interchange protein [unclassified Vibrio]|uniref:DsbE family thiol:disulfide interchange protein n=1 Tax=Vibrio sp. HB236076 TaxID=3232307 RepID=A0AB39HEV0_9VIBR|nr:DsbE family thiol:disulfide interchange protein [Vibrio sp. HB161653]MDP5254768.1 DsbE family thiol:disulfide interchange protein [Vibrio sp. HB161653]